MKEEIFALVERYFESKEKEPFVPGKTTVTVGFPCFDHNEVNAALKALLDLRISQGENVRTFERQYSEYVGTAHGIAVNSGSSANLLAIEALIRTGKVTRGSEVIIPSATFATVASPIIQLGLIPVFVDVEESSYNISPEAIKKAITPNTGLIMPVHSLGCPADMERIMAIADEHGLPVLEDCCEAHGARIGEKVVGSFGTIAAYSFFVAHNMTSGEGGMVMTDDDELMETVRSLREFGRVKDFSSYPERFSYTDGSLTEYDERYVFEELGYNVRMSDIHAALGIEQLKKLDRFNDIRVENAGYLTNGLARFERYIRLPKTIEGTYHSFYGYTMLIEEGASFDRTELVRFLESKNIQTRAFMGGSLAIQPGFRDERIKVHDLAFTQRLLNDAFFIGCHPYIDEEQMDYVIGAFEEFFEKIA